MISRGYPPFSYAFVPITKPNYLAKLFWATVDVETMGSVAMRGGKEVQDEESNLSQGMCDVVGGMYYLILSLTRHCIKVK